MVSERLIHELEVGDLPKIELGNFKWQPVDRVMALTAALTTTADVAADGDQRPIARQFLDNPDFQPAEALTDAEFPLNLLQNKTFAGTGCNTIWRPRSKTPIPPPVAGASPDVLAFNLTAETMAFSGPLGDVPNRGVTAQADLVLRGIPYVQRVGAFENPATGLNDSKKPAGIHFEPGVFMFVPKSDDNPPGQPATINRMASIPHGTTINAQGVAPSTTQTKGSPENHIAPTSIIPFTIKEPHTEVAQPFSQHLNFTGTDHDNRLPNPLNIFNSTWK